LPVVHDPLYGERSRAHWDLSRGHPGHSPPDPDRQQIPYWISSPRHSLHGQLATKSTCQSCSSLVPLPVSRSGQGATMSSLSWTLVLHKSPGPPHLSQDLRSFSPAQREEGNQGES
jgi:hypothetical protein